VNNLVYLRWAETVRVAYFVAIGMNVDFSGDVTGPILAWQDCKYIFPMTFPDVAIVGARVTEIGEDRFTLETGIFSEKHDRIAAVTQQVIVPYNYATLTKVSLPEAWVAGIHAIEK
ncbi:MAG: thioesterase family protein, partial [Bacteroidota bacterium]